MSREAMKLALEALESAHPRFGIATERHQQAIDALRAALNAPPVLWYHPLSGRVRFEETSKWIPLYK
jgi:hypothetical protein